jgi:ABC-2 type transport system permease protein
MIAYLPKGRLSCFLSLSARIILMRKYWAIFKVNWQKSVEYRADFIGHLGMGVITFLVMYFIWSAVFKNRETFNGYTFSGMITYVLMTRFLHFAQRGNIGRMIADDIKEGRISAYLLKPVDYIRWWFSIFLADRFFEFWVRLGMIIIFFLALPQIIVFPGLGRFLVFLSFLGISLIINFLTNIFLAAFAFWVTDIRLFRSAIMIVIDFFAGALVPLDVMPTILKNIGLVLPFQYTTFFPIKLYQGLLEPREVIFGVFLAGSWIVMLFFVLAIVWRQGLKNYEAIGQ